MKQDLSCSCIGGHGIAAAGMFAHTVVGITASVMASVGTTESILQFVAGGTATAGYAPTNTRNIGYEGDMTSGFEWGD